MPFICLYRCAAKVHDRLIRGRWVDNNVQPIADIHQITSQIFIIEVCICINNWFLQFIMIFNR